LGQPKNIPQNEYLLFKLKIFPESMNMCISGMDFISKMLISDQNSPDIENVLVLPENYGYRMRSVRIKSGFGNQTINVLKSGNLPVSC